MWSVAPRKGSSLSRSEWQQGCLVVKVLLRDCSFKVADLFDWKGKRLEINRSPNFNSTCSRPSAPNSSPFLEPPNTLLSWNSSQTSFICSTLIEEHGKTTKLTERKMNPSALNKPTLHCHKYHLYSTLLLSCHQLILSCACNYALFLFHNTHKNHCSTCCRSPTCPCTNISFLLWPGSFSSASPRSRSRSLPTATTTPVLMGGFMI